MKIAHIIFELGTGGAETMLVDIANQQKKANHDIYIYIINNNADKILLNSFLREIKVYCFHRKSGSKNILPIIQFLLKISLLKPDVVHAHNSSIIQLISWLPCPKILTAHCLLNFSSNHSKYDHIVCISKEVLKHMLKQGNKNLVLIQNGIPEDQIEKSQKKTRHSPFRLVNVARLNTDKNNGDKGQRIVIQALYILDKKYACTNITFDIFGDGSARVSLNEQISSLHLSDRVKIHGFVERLELFKKLKNFDLMVHPSLNEGFGLTVAEGMAAGLPVLVSDFGGPVEIIEEGRLGFTFKTGSADDCARALHEILQMEPEKLSTLAKSGQEHVCKKYSVSYTAKNYINLYRKSISCS